jgi:hypothetical protein
MLANALAASCRATLICAMVGLTAVWRPATALAGPPLIADDPHTVGVGVAQPIFATSVFQRSGETLLRGPLVDLTVGVADSLDITLVTSLNGRSDPELDPQWELTGVLTPGIKWEFFRTDRGSLCFSPAFAFRTVSPERPFPVLSLQGELSVGRIDAAIGFDVGYLPVFQGNDEWFGSLYGRSAVNDRLVLLGELWSAGSVSRRSAELGFSIGLSFRMLDAVELLAAVSPGVVSFDTPLLNARAYLGFQYTFVRPRRRNATLSSRLEAEHAGK